MEGLTEYLDFGIMMLKNAFMAQNVLYTSTGFIIGLVSVAAFTVLCLLIKLLGEIVMAGARIVQKRVLTFEEVRRLNAKMMAQCIKYAVAKNTITREEGDKMLEQMAKRFARWEFLPKKKPTVPKAADLKAAIRARLTKSTAPDLTKAPVKPVAKTALKTRTKLGNALSFLKPKTA